MSKNKIYLPIFLSIAIAIGIIIGSTLNYKRRAAFLFGSSPQEDKIKRLIDFIEYDYVDDIDTDSLLDGTIRNIVEKLDPHSVYIPAKDHDFIAEKMEGKFVGIGIQFRMFGDSLTVVKTIKNGPSERAGIKAGDRILIAENDTLYGKKLKNDDIIARLKGQPDTKIDLLVYRRNSNKIIPFSITRGDIPIKSIEVAYMLTNDFGYIKLNSFTATTYIEFKKALKKLKNKGMQKMILDLRGNPGGFIGVTTKIIDEFLENDKLIVFTKDKKGRVEKSYATSKGDFEKGKVYVLMDENSASASEILAGALQDNDKGIIVGRRSFGKGLVQQDMELGDGSSVRLTTARYYTPTGRSIQKPYELNKKKDYYKDGFQKRFSTGELTSKDSIKVIDSLKFTTPKGKIVYGGGGISPDVFVAIDTTIYYHDLHLNKMNNFVFNYIDTNRGKFINMTLTSFLNHFDEDNLVFNQFLSKFKKQPKDLSKTRYYFKAFFARELFDENGFYQVLNIEDKMIQKVLELENQYQIEISDFRD
jgi:carboxyl-terminal processing protease